MPPIHRVGPSPASKISLTRSGPRLFLDGPEASHVLRRLHVGDLLIGRVVKILEGSRLLMSFRGTELVAATTFPLPEGAKIRGIVQTKGPPVALRIVSEGLSDKTKVLFRFKSLASRFLPATEDHPAIAFLKNQGRVHGNRTEPLARWLDAFAVGKGTSLDPEQVRAAILQGGTFYERKLRQWVESGGRGAFQEAEIDLKGAAVKLLAQAERVGEGAAFLPGKATEPLESLVGKIELFQTANWLAQEEGFALVFQIPLRFEGNLLRTAHLFVDLPKEKRGKREGFRILLLLDMGELGRFQIDAIISREAIAAAIGVDREETFELVQSMTGELKKGLEDQGLLVNKIECMLLEKAATKDDLFHRVMAVDDLGTVNIRV